MIFLQKKTRRVFQKRRRDLHHLGPSPAVRRPPYLRCAANTLSRLQRCPRRRKVSLYSGTMVRALVQIASEVILTSGTRLVPPRPFLVFRRRKLRAPRQCGRLHDSERDSQHSTQVWERQGVQGVLRDVRIDIAAVHFGPLRVTVLRCFLDRLSPQW